MNEPTVDSSASVPTPEQLVGRQVRLLRQGRGWSQQEVAEKMQAYGYQWSQATVTRLESATRPIRVNELADLALLFDVSVTQFLAPDIAKSERDDLDALEREIADLARRRAVVEKDAESEAVLAAAAAAAHARELADLARIDGRLTVLKQWHPRFAEIAEAATGVADRREQSQP